MADIIRASCEKYLWSVLQAHKQEADIRNEKIAEASACTKRLVFWREVNKAGVLARPSCCSAVGGFTTPADDIADVLRPTYADILLILINESIYKHLDRKCVAENWQFCTHAEVAAACKQLKPFKKDSDLLLNSSTLIKALENFLDFLCGLFNAIILQGYVSSCWKTGLY